MNIETEKTIRRLEVKGLTSQIQSPATKRNPKWILLGIIFCMVAVWFVGSWGNLSKADKESLYQQLVIREQAGSLSEDSIMILCQLAKELKRDIPKVCSENATYAKTSGKNGKHVNKSKKETACEKMLISKQKRDSLRSLPNKTPVIKKQLYKADDEYKKNKQKCEDTGENHSQKPKR